MWVLLKYRELNLNDFFKQTFEVAIGHHLTCELNLCLVCATVFKFEATLQVLIGNLRIMQFILQVVGIESDHFLISKFVLFEKIYTLYFGMQAKTAFISILLSYMISSLSSS